MTNENYTTFIQTLIPILITALSGTIVAVAKYLTTYLDQRTKAAIKEEQAATIQRYLARLNETVVDVVAALNQTTVDALKEAAADGKLTEYEKEYVFKQAVETIRSIIGETGLEILALVFEDVNALIVAKVDRAVGELNAKKAAAKGAETDDKTSSPQGTPPGE